MEDAKIDLIAREVLTSLKKSRAESAESAIAGREQGSPETARAEGPAVHLQLLSVSGGVVGQPCVIEPDKPCVGSLRCRSFGH